jgi:aminopeptidase N
MKESKIIILFCIICLTLASTLMAQRISPGTPPIPYQETPAKINDLVHTKLDLRFDYEKCYVYGKEWVTLKPHFYPTDSLRVDAKGMDIHSIALVKNNHLIRLSFVYDSLSVAIRLDKVYHNNETYTIYIDYTAKPNALKVRKEEQGLHFINPDGSEKNKPTQIWTMGEPECNSAWFPTIDKPNQKTTEEISMTIPAKYVTLSNGRLAAQKNNADGTRTDTWKMELPHSPYLFMITVGDFTIVKDGWHGKEVSYYLEPKFAQFAKNIFGYTPEAMSFFSNILGIDYPWNKYAQIRVHGFNGGQENTTATEFNEDGQSSPRELADRGYESGNVHELFHQWFGDYVTEESWSNLALSESFADLGEILWAEHKFGQDIADEHVYQGLQGYLDNPDAWTKELIRFRYAHEQDMFDGVTYQKGGRILNMLRHYLGNAAFYKGLHIYLERFGLKNAEAHQLRLAMEEASGQDLNWFFNQWFFGSGHPVLNISYNWNEATKTQTVYLQQLQDGNVFLLPMAVDVYANGKKERHQVWMRRRSDTLIFNLAAKPNLVNIDAEKMLIAKKTDSKSIREYAFQYFNAPLYIDRYEAIDAATAQQSDTIGQKILIAALKDKYYGLRIKAIQTLDMSNEAIRNAAQPVLVFLAQYDQSNLARAEAITQLGELKISTNLEIFKGALNKSTSYAVQGTALNGIRLIDTVNAFHLAKAYERDSKGKLRDVIITIYCREGGNMEWPYVYHYFADPGSPLQYSFTRKFADFTGRLENPMYAQQGINAITNLVIQLKKFDKAPIFIEILNQIKTQREQLHDNASVRSVDLAIAKINEAVKENLEQKTDTR